MHRSIPTSVNDEHGHGVHISRMSLEYTQKHHIHYPTSHYTSQVVFGIYNRSCNIAMSNIRYRIHIPVQNVRSHIR